MNPSRKRRWRLLPIILGLALVGLVTLAVINREDEELGLGQEIRYDDFGFAVNRFWRTKSAGADEFAETAEGEFLVVELLVSNRGPAAPFRFKPEFVELENEDGTVLQPSERAMAAWHHFPDEAKACPERVLAGSQCLHEVVFEIPAASSGWSVRISLGGAVADILDLIFYGDKSIRLE